MSLQAPPLLIHLYAILPQCITAGFIWNASLKTKLGGKLQEVEKENSLCST